MKYITRVFPEVNVQLDRWACICSNAGDSELKKQALASICLKKFHAQGGSVYALYPGADMQKTVGFIVALQTISDYLDNLCDRAGVTDEAAFRQLHLSMLDAVDPERAINDYYSLYPYKEDNRYLEQLVKECRSAVKDLPSYYLVIDYIRNYIRLYSNLQVYKHLPLGIREERVKHWAENYLESYPGITCWEFAAASGSTLGVFLLYAAAQDPGLTASEVSEMDRAYFPWVCGLHILLDYYIDAREDMETGDLNFTSYYDSLKQCEERISFFIRSCLDYCSTLKYHAFHITVVKGLLAMYLSDTKAFWGLNRLASKTLVKNGGSRTPLYFNMCRMLRAAGVI